MSDKTRKRSALSSTVRILSCVVIATLVAACGGESGESDNDDAEKVLTIAMIEDIVRADNMFAYDKANDRLVLGSTVYDPLFTSGLQGETEPALATEATPSDDLKTWTVKLREGVTFTNGKDFTSADVIANFAAFKDPENGSQYGSDMANVEVSAVDDLTVEFTMDTPNAEFPSYFVDQYYISDLDARKNKGGMLEPEEVPIGTGPYSWNTHTPGSEATFVKNPDYWRGEPPIDKVVFKVIADGQAAVLALQKGEVDIVGNYVPHQMVPQLEEDDNIEVLSSLSGTYLHAYTNFEKERRGGYKDGAKVREGLQLLFNTEEIVPELIGAFGELATQPSPPYLTPDTPALDPIPFDPDRAKELLSEGGIEPGDEIRLLASDRRLLCEWAATVQSNMKEAGYDAILDCVDSSAMPPEVAKYEWDLCFFSYTGKPTAATNYKQRWSSERAKEPVEDTETNRDPELDRLIDQMTATADPAEYGELGRQVADRIVNIDRADVPGYFLTNYYPVGPRVKGLEVATTGFYGILYNAIGVVSVE